ncbi:MAG: NAD-dependent epimerase/dehydratase family protein [Acidimicrobiia bacterium]|nr:NAD-dependent epimerase/dehydratase family protein [Acidimicrobiia bacterium]
MTVLVTGGTGVVGRPVIRMLVESDRTVRGLARSEESATRLAELGATPIMGDIERPESLPDAMSGCEVVYHIAGLVSFCPADPSALYRVNVEGTRNVVQAARRAGVRRVIHTSSVAALGEKPGTVGDETTTHSGHYTSHYARSKHQGEQIALAEAGDMEVVVVNPASVQGAGRVVGSGGLLLQAVKGKLRLLVDSPISIVDAQDCAQGHIAAEQLGVPGERYVLSGFTISLREAWQLLGELTGKHYPVRFVPKPLLTLLGPIGDLVGSRIRAFPICRETIGLMRYGVRYDGSRAERELGLEYRTARETFARALDSFRASGLI